MGGWWALIAGNLQPNNMPRQVKCLLTNVLILPVNGYGKDGPFRPLAGHLISCPGCPPLSPSGRDICLTKLT